MLCQRQIACYPCLQNQEIPVVRRILLPCCCIGKQTLGAPTTRSNSRRPVPYSLHDRPQYGACAGISGVRSPLNGAPSFRRIRALQNQEGEPERSPILSGIVAHCDPTLFRELMMSDVLRSVCGDAYVKSSRGVRIRHSYWRSGWRFRGRVLDHNAIRSGG